MPTVLVEYKHSPYVKDLELSPVGKTASPIRCVVDALPEILAPLLTVAGREIHDGGVTEKEIIVDARQYSHFARNINDIQVTVRAHRFEDRINRLDEITNSIRQSMHSVLRQFDCDLDIGIEVDLVDMGYASIHAGID